MKLFSILRVLGAFCPLFLAGSLALGQGAAAKGPSTGGGGGDLTRQFAEWSVVVLDNLEELNQSVIKVDVLRDALKKSRLVAVTELVDPKSIDSARPVVLANQQHLYAWGAPGLIQIKPQWKEKLMDNHDSVAVDIIHELMRASEVYDDEGYRISVQRLKLHEVNLMKRDDVNRLMGIGKMNVSKRSIRQQVKLREIFLRPNSKPESQSIYFLGKTYRGQVCSAEVSMKVTADKLGLSSVSVQLRDQIGMGFGADDKISEKVEKSTSFPNHQLKSVSFENVLSEGTPKSSYVPYATQSLTMEIDLDEANRKGEDPILNLTALAGVSKSLNRGSLQSALWTDGAGNCLQLKPILTLKDNKIKQIMPKIIVAADADTKRVKSQIFDPMTILDTAEKKAGLEKRLLSATVTCSQSGDREIACEYSVPTDYADDTLTIYFDIENGQLKFSKTRPADYVFGC